MNIHPDDAGFTYSSESEWDRADAYQRGSECPEMAWVLTDRDVWHTNPNYRGPAVPHPEDAWSDHCNAMAYIDDQDEMEARGGPVFEVEQAGRDGHDWSIDSDDIPF